MTCIKIGIVILIFTLLAGCAVPNTEVQIPEATPPEETVGVASVAIPPAPTSSTEAAAPAYFTPSFTRTPSSGWQATSQTPTATASLTATVTPNPQTPFCTPLAGHTLADLHEILTNPFNPPPPRKDTGHHGVDFAYYRRGDRYSILGVTVESVLPGRIAAVVLNRIPYGNMVIVETPYTALDPGLVDLLELPDGQSLYLLYAHMNVAPLVHLGDTVACGQALGEVGNTPKGWSSDPHLHLETRAGPPDTAFQGMVFYDTGATVEEMDNYRLWRMSDKFHMLDPMKLLEYGLSEQATGNSSSR